MITDQPHEDAWTRLFEALDAIDTVQSLADPTDPSPYDTNERR